MFMYVAYTAAHSPLQPLPRHAAHCQHISHSRRRDYCGLVVGLDEALRNLTASIITHLGDDTILVVASDNGGAAYFGGTVRYCLFVCPSRQMVSRLLNQMRKHTIL